MAPDGNVFEPPDWLDREDEVLAPYAMRTRQSRGRKHPEADHPYRTAYQRDRDRVVHSTAFRRLMYKTQVLLLQTSDHHRTRLTHTLEVAQISRTIARQLGLNEDLTEAIALMHDLGHPPFGHAGESTLDACMKDHGGFEHNWHGLRIVEFLEYRYADFPGLNLTWEVREAQALHSKRRDLPEIRAFLTPPPPPSQGGAASFPPPSQGGAASSSPPLEGGVASLSPPLEGGVASLSPPLEGGVQGGCQPSLEAQVVDAADSLAYNAHDVDDALDVGIITSDELAGVPFWKEAVERARAKHKSLAPPQFQPTVVRALIDWQVSDLLEQARANLRRRHISSVEDVRSFTNLLIAPSPEVVALKAGLEQFLHERVYRNYRVMRMATKGQRMLQMLFDELCKHPEQLPQRYLIRAKQWSLERTVCDYLAGMTDRYAQDEFLRLFQPYTVL